MKITELKPQIGRQEQFLSSNADIAIYGGAAFGGKTWALLFEPLRHVNNGKFKAVIFRRTYTQIKVEGGMWDEASNIYPLLNAIPKEGAKEYGFKSGATIRFAHLQHEKNRFDWQGSQVPFFGFDQLEQFTQKQFEYLVFSRGRTDCGVKPYVRATCNPDPDSFVLNLISWWIEPKTGYPILERSGKKRYFIRHHNQYEWSNTSDDLMGRFPDSEPKTLTFIAANINDNTIGNEQNPSYLSSLKALNIVDEQRLLYGNWKIRETAGMLFRRSFFEIVDHVPENIEQKIRYWDRAASLDGDWTAGCLLSKVSDNYYVEHIERFRAELVESAIKNVAAADGHEVTVGIEQDPGQAGKVEAHYYSRELSNKGFIVKLNPVSQNKILRAKPVASQAKQGKIKIVRGHWNDEFISELENFPEGKYDDQVDAFSGAFSLLYSNADIYVG